MEDTHSYVSITNKETTNLVMPRNNKQITLYLSDFKTDANPKYWLSRYRRISAIHLIVMFFFYLEIGNVLYATTNFALGHTISDYKEPSLSYTLLPLLTAGPIEDSLFFGIPFYLYGNYFIILISGIVWSAIHILSTNTIDATHLAYGHWLFVLPTVFFHYRTWISGKGWFAIISHSLSNGSVFLFGCSYPGSSGNFQCGSFLLHLDITAGVVIGSGVLLGITYVLYMMRKRNGDIEKITIREGEKTHQPLKYLRSQSTLVLISAFAVSFGAAILVISLPLWSIDKLVMNIILTSYGITYFITTYGLLNGRRWKLTRWLCIAAIGLGSLLVGRTLTWSLIDIFGIIISGIILIYLYRKSVKAYFENNDHLFAR